jgi:hypothetical protein
VIDFYSLCVLYATSIRVLLTDYVFPFFRCAVYYQPNFCSHSMICFIYHYPHYRFSFSCSIYASYTTQYQPCICIQLRHRSNYYKYYNHYYVLSTSLDLFTLASSSFASLPRLFEQVVLEVTKAAHPSSPPHHLHTSLSSSAAASTAFGILQADLGNSAMMVGGWYQLKAIAYLDIMQNDL